MSDSMRFERAAERYEVWVEPRPLEGRFAYRMTLSALHPGTRPA